MIRVIKNNRITIIITLFAILAWTLVFNSAYLDSLANDSSLYASIARNIYRGNGFVSDVIDFNDIVKLQDKQVIMSPVGVLPFYPVVLSLFFFVLGASTKTVIISSGIFYILTVPLIYLLTKDFFGYKAGIISSLFYIFTPQLFFNFSLSGLTEPFYTFLIISSFYIAYKSKSFKGFMLAGIILGLSCMVRYNSFFFLIPFGVYVYIKNDEEKIKSALYFLVGLSLILLPYFIRNGWLYHSPLIDLISKIHRESAGTIQNLPLLEFISITFHKIIINVVDFKYILFGGNYFNPYLVVFFLISMMKTNDKNKVELFKGLFFVVLLVELLLAFSIFRKPFAIYRQLIPLIPIILIFTSGFLVSTVEKLIAKKKILNYMLVSIISILIISNFFQYNRLMYKKHVANKSINFAKLGKVIKSSTGKDAIIATNIPREIAWFSDRKTLGLPSSPQDSEKIKKENMSRFFVLIIDVDSKQWKKWHIISETWKRIMDKQSICGYELSFSYKGRNLRALLFKKGSV